MEMVFGRMACLSTLFVLSLVLLSGADRAAASRFSLSRSTFRYTFSELRMSVGGEEGTLRCPVTLEGSFHSRTLLKTAGALIGYITRASVSEASCRGGVARFDATVLPAHITYESFAGTLPTDIRRIINPYTMLKWEADQETIIGRVRCIFRSSPAEPVIQTITMVSGVVTSVTNSGTIRPAAGSSFWCRSDRMEEVGGAAADTVILS